MWSGSVLLKTYIFSSGLLSKPSMYQAHSATQCLTSFVFWFICASVMCHNSFEQELFTLTIFDSDAYASSIAENSRPEFAIDADFEEPQPTCFLTHPKIPDFRGYHWLLVDLKAMTHNIKEVRIIMGNTLDKLGETQSVDAYVITELEVPKMDIHHLESQPKPSLSWDLPSFQLCTSATATSPNERTMDLPCYRPLDGRWIAIRSRTPMNICLMNVLVKSAFEGCFEVIESGSGEFGGTIYRLIRHTPFNACRVACMRDAKCEAVFFTKIGRSGTCQLVHLFGTANNTAALHSAPPDKLRCADQKCAIDVNHCHEGLLRPLRAVTEAPSVGTSPPEVAFAHATAQFVDDWKILEMPSITTNTDSAKTYLLSIYFEGELNCSDWDCGLMYIYSVNSEGSETLCTILNTKHVASLVKVRHFCNRDNPPVDPRLIRLKWNPTLVEDVQQQPQLIVHISGGHVRVSHRMPNIYSRKSKPADSTAPPTHSNSALFTRNSTLDPVTTGDRTLMRFAANQTYTVANSKSGSASKIFDSTTETPKQTFERRAFASSPATSDLSPYKDVLDFNENCDDCDFFSDESDESNQINGRNTFSNVSAHLATPAQTGSLDKSMNEEQSLYDRKVFQHRGASFNQLYQMDSDNLPRNTAHTKRKFLALTILTIASILFPF